MTVTIDEQRYYLPLAAAYVRGSIPELARHQTDGDAVAAGLAAGLRLHRFKRSRVLPRVRRVLGLLRGFHPTSLLDIGSGRGAFLWPLLEAFPGLPVTAIDGDPERARQLRALQLGGLPGLSAHHMDGTTLTFDDDEHDVVTALEVLEHIPDVERAVQEIVRVARRALLISVPSREDDNPGHVHLLSAARLQQLLHAAGARRTATDGVPNHLIITATLP